MALNDFGTSEVAILLSTCNKYYPGTQIFRLQSLAGLNQNSNVMDTTSLSKENLVNKDTSNIAVSEINTASVISLEVPKQIAVKYPKKFIPPGTRFIVSFPSGDITKPVIVGGEF